LSQKEKGRKILNEEETITCGTQDWALIRSHEMEAPGNRAKLVGGNKALAKGEVGRGNRVVGQSEHLFNLKRQ